MGGRGQVDRWRWSDPIVRCVRQLRHLVGSKPSAFFGRGANHLQAKLASPALICDFRRNYMEMSGSRSSSVRIDIWNLEGGKVKRICIKVITVGVFCNSMMMTSYPVCLLNFLLKYILVSAERISNISIPEKSSTQLKDAPPWELVDTRVCRKKKLLRSVFLNCCYQQC